MSNREIQPEDESNPDEESFVSPQQNEELEQLKYRTQQLQKRLQQSETEKHTLFSIVEQLQKNIAEKEAELQRRDNQHQTSKNEAKTAMLNISNLFTAIGLTLFVTYPVITDVRFIIGLTLFIGGIIFFIINLVTED